MALMKYELAAMKKDMDVGMTVRERRRMVSDFVEDMTDLVSGTAASKLGGKVTFSGLQVRRGSEVTGIECFVVGSGHLAADNLRDTSFVIESELAKGVRTSN